MFAVPRKDGETRGVMTLDRSGQVALFHCDEQNYVPYITKVLGKYDLGVQIARDKNLPGAEGVFQQKFEALIRQGNYETAAKLAAEGPQGVLRTSETIRKLQGAPRLAILSIIIGQRTV